MVKPIVRYDTQRLVVDMAERGWMASDLARVSGVSKMTVTRFLRGERQTAKMAKKFADALGHSTRRYIVTASREAVA
jgi:transcriptional regulator with XRE-family HTH domain